MGGKTGHVMTLANSIIGVGILAMPFCFQKCGIILSILLLILSNFISRISCHYLMKSSILTRRKNIEFLAFYAYGTSGKLLVELCTIGYLIGTCIAYFVVVGDLGPQIAAKLFNLNVTDTLRTWVMIVVTIFCVIPLGLLRNVDSLSTVCTASIGFYFCLVTKVMAESKVHISSGDWLEHVDLWKPSGVLQCLPIFGMALSCQMQLFEVFDSVPNASLEKMNEIVKSSTLICTLVYILVGFFGYVAFCTMPFSGNILVNFSQSVTSDVIKIGFVLSVAFSFPLVIFPCRASLYSLLYRRGHSDAAHYIPETRFKPLTITIVVISLVISLLIPSIELVIGLVGSTIGVAICIMFPAACFLKVSKRNTSEKVIAQLILIFGFCLMTFGTYANLNAIDDKQSEVTSVVQPQPVDAPDNSALPIFNNDEVIMNLSESVRGIINQLPKAINDDAKNLVPKIPGHRAKAMDITLEKRLEELSNHDKLNNEAINKEEQEMILKDADKPISSKEKADILNMHQDRLKEVVQEAQEELQKDKEKLSGDLNKELNDKDVQNIIEGQISVVDGIQQKLEHIDELLKNPNVLENHLPHDGSELKKLNDAELDNSYVDITLEPLQMEEKLKTPPASPVVKLLLKNANKLANITQSVVPASYKVGEIVSGIDSKPIENVVQVLKTFSDNKESAVKESVVKISEVKTAVKNDTKINTDDLMGIKESSVVKNEPSKTGLKEPLVNDLKSESSPKIIIEDKDKDKILQKSENDITAKKENENDLKKQEEDKENIDAIRRDLLEADNKQEDVTTIESSEHNREKREAESCEKNGKLQLPKNDVTLEQDIHLVDLLNSKHSLLSDLQLDSKMIGRDLKFINEDDTTGNS